MATLLTLERYQRNYFDSNSAPAVQAGLFLQNHLLDARQALHDFAALNESQRTERVAKLLYTYSDLYRIDTARHVQQVYKTVPWSQVFPGYSFSRGPLGAYLRETAETDRLSQLIRGYEDSRSSLYYAVPIEDGQLLGRLDLGHVQEFLEQFSSFSQTPALLVGANGFVMLSSEPDLMIPAIDQAALTGTPALDAAFDAGGQRWIPVASEQLDIGAHVVILLPSAPLIEQRNALISSLVIAVGGILILLVIKTIGFRRAFIQPFTALADRVRAVERGDFAAVGVDSAALPSRFTELADIEARFSEMTDAIRQREQRLSDIGAEARAASRAKTRFLANMSHEIRTPMNVVLGLTQLLEREPLASEHRAIVDKIQAASGTLVAILNDILDLSKIEANELTIESRPFLPTDLLDRLKRTFSVAAASKGLRFSISPPPAGVGALLGDPERIQQILVNLVGNAIKFTDRGGVSIRIDARWLDDDRVALRFAVSDTGIGIDPAHVSQLFTPFHQIDDGSTRRYGGTGLGLSICHRLAELMNGRIHVDSRLGEGSTFRLELTCVSTTQLPAPSRSLPAMDADQQLKGHAVLVVDDSDSNRFLLESVLTRAGAEVDCVTNGEQAIARLTDAAARYSVVLMDLQMPIMDGIEAISRIRANPAWSALRIAALTADALGSEHERALRAGANRVFVKPLDLDLLVDMLQALPTINNRPTLPFDAELSNRLRQHFNAEHADAADALRQALADGRTTDATRRLHTIKGMAAQLGHVALAEQAALLENRLLRGETAHADASIDLIAGLLTAFAGVDEQPAAQPADSAVSLPVAIHGEPRKTGSTNRLSRILIVDDDPVAAGFLRDVLDGCGTLELAGSGREAIRLISAAPADLVLLDAMMPGMDGFETCRELLALQPGLPVIFVTAANEMRHEIHALKAGAVDFIHKPINPAVVRARVAAQQRLHMQAEALAQSQQSLIEEAAARSRLEERERLLQDMHDGFGSQLATVRMQLQRGEIPYDKVDQLLRDCLDDLRLVVQEMENPAHTLADAIADFRFRLAGRLIADSPTIVWTITLEQMPPPRPKIVLQTLRILQEAVNNTLLHAQASTLTIAVTHDPDDGLTLRVADNGLGVANRPSGTSRGINNMFDRARRLGGTLHIDDARPGTQVVFRLPQQALIVTPSDPDDDRA